MNKDKDTQEKIKANLEALMSDMGVSSEPQKGASAKPTSRPDPNSDVDMMDKIDHPNSQPMNIHAEQLAFEKEAKKMLNSVMKFYVDQKHIKKNDYILAKKKIDEMTLSSIMFSLKFTQKAMIKILEDIDMGNTHPRNFEAFANLNNQMMSTIKHQAAYMITLEEGYKKIQYDSDTIEEARKEKPSEDEAETIDKLDGGPIKVRGTKNLMETIQIKMIEEAKIVDKHDDEKPPRLTDPNYRPVNPMQSDVPEDEKQEDEGYDLDDNYFQ